MRIDRLLWQLRFVKSRTLAQALVATGHLRRNGERVLRASCDVSEGDVLTIPLRAGVQVVEGPRTPRPARPRGRGASSLPRA